MIDLDDYKPLDQSLLAINTAIARAEADFLASEAKVNEAIAARTANSSSDFDEPAVRAAIANLDHAH